MGGDVFLSNWIDDSFGVVDTGAPGLGVLYENRPVGVTDAKGMLLVPTLRSYEKNNISIDQSNLPVDAEVEGTSQVVAPANHGGALVARFAGFETFFQILCRDDVRAELIRGFEGNQRQEVRREAQSGGAEAA